MADDSVRFIELRDDLPFGTKVLGATRENLKNEGTRSAIKKAFEVKGLLVFEDVEQSPLMQLAISDVLGPLKDHPVAAVHRAGEDLAPGVIDLNSNLDDQVIVELAGKQLSNWLPWHFDHSYNNELNRAGVLRPIVIAPEGGLTGFADGIELYKSLPPDLRKRIEGLNVIYHLGVMIMNMRFGKPSTLRALRNSAEGVRVEEEAKKVPRAIHPAVWTRDTGEKILHVGLLHAVGVEGHEDPEGNALLEEVCHHIAANPRAYYHQWKLGQMLTWDNWRVIHCVTGTDPKYDRRMHRTTIKGDYGLGRFETGGKTSPILQKSN
jgi:taurine dioxygenase